MLSGTYGGQLFKKDKRLFFAVALFFILSIASNFILRLETTPFFVWDMYSHPFPRQSVYTINEVRYNGRLLNIGATWEEPRKMFLFYPLGYYIAVQQTNAGKDPFSEYMENHWAPKHPAFVSLLPSLYNTPDRFRAFPDWYMRYLSQQAGMPVSTIQVIRKKLCFTETGNINLLSSDTILQIRQ